MLGRRWKQATEGAIYKNMRCIEIPLWKLLLLLGHIKGCNNLKEELQVMFPTVSEILDIDECVIVDEILKSNIKEKDIKAASVMVRMYKARIKRHD